MLNGGWRKGQIIEIVEGGKDDYADIRPGRSTQQVSGTQVRVIVT